MLALFLEALDQTIVGTAMPRIIAELHGLDRYSWVVTAYILASMIMIPTIGKLSDQFGRKWFLLLGTALFLLGSVLAGASQSMEQLIVFRGVQGLGAGIGMALIATVMGDLFAPAERAKWSSLFGVVYGIASLLGPALGGWLAEHGPPIGGLIVEETRWRWIFYINLPVGLIAVVALLVFLPARLSVANSTWAGLVSLRRIDFSGALLCAAVTICLNLGLTWGGAVGAPWRAATMIGMLALSVVLLLLFVFAERAASEPILPLELFRNRVFRIGALLSLLQNMVLLGLVLYLPLFFQGVLAVSPASTGMIMTPFSLSLVAGAMVSSMLINRRKRYRGVAIGSALLMSMGALLIALLTPASPIPLAIVFMILTGVGSGTFFALPMVAVQNALPANQLGVSTAAVRYLGQVGANLGIAIIGATITSAVPGDLIRRLPASDAERFALAGALQHGFLAILVFAIIALVCTFFLQETPSIAMQETSSIKKTVQADAEPGQELARA
jgi:MFS family permease